MPKKTAVTPTIMFLDIETSGLNVLSSRVVAVGWMDEVGKATVLVARRPWDEKKILAEILGMVASWDLLVTWGGEFNIPFITSRSLHNGLNPTPLHEVMHLDLQRYVRERLGITRLGLIDVAGFLGVAGWRKLGGREIAHQYLEALTESGRVAAGIRRHCVGDLILTRGVFLKLRPMLRKTNPELAL